MKNKPLLHPCSLESAYWNVFLCLIWEYSLFLIEFLIKIFYKKFKFFTVRFSFLKIQTGKFKAH